LFTRKSLETLIEPFLQELDLKLYDMDLPRGNQGTLILYIYRGTPATSKIGLDECAQLSRKILNDIDVNSTIDAVFNLEISTPGINRKLRTLENLIEADGERVKVKIRGSEGVAKKVVIGVLQVVDAVQQKFIVNDELTEASVGFSFSEISEARVDFQFG
jgi:ribosome maturation factor RimP